MSIEFIEILNNVKEIIFCENFNENIYDDNIYTKEYLKKILLSNNKILSTIEKIKAKNKLNRLNNKNIFNLIKNFETHEKENKIIINSLTNFSLIYNEPKHIQKLNFLIFTKIIENVLINAKEYRLVSLING